MAKGQPATLLAPGFRFHPTDEELVRFYLKRKVANKPFKVDAISVVDVYKSEPWDLPGKSKLKSRDLEWYFFSLLDKKYSNGSKTNRATEKGYWKTTGKDRAVRCGSRSVGMKKTLVYHQGRAPHGERSNWVMHEYRLTDEELQKGGLSQKDTFVLCRIFQKSGTGPKNGEQYGAPFVEEEWDDDEEVEVAVLPVDEVLVAPNEVTVADDEYVETNDLFQQNFHVPYSFENPVPPINCGYGEANHYKVQSGDVIETDLKTPMDEGLSRPSYGDANNYEVLSGNVIETDLKPLMDEGLSRPAFNLPDDQNNLWGLHGQQQIDSKLIDQAFVEQPSNSNNSAEANYTFDPYYVTDDNPYYEGFVVGDNAILNSVAPEVESSGFDIDEYLNYFDVEDENLTFDASELMGNDSNALEPVSATKVIKGESDEASSSCQNLSEMHVNDDSSCSKKRPEPIEFEPDTKPSYFKQMLGGIPAPPAYASEFPLKGAAIRRHAGQSSTSIHVTAGIIRIESTISGTGSMDWPLSKSGDVNVIFSFHLSEDNLSRSSLVPTQSSFSGKPPSAVSLSWIFLILFWVLIFSVTYRIGSFVCAK